MERFETHSVMALFTFSLPVGLTCYWLFQYFMKAPLIEVLPDGAYARWKPSETPAPIDNVKQWICAALGVLFGAFTHLVWDAFTHEGARGVRMIPNENEWYFDVGRYHLPFTRLMQDGNSLLGLLAVIAFLCFALRRGRPQAVGPRALSETERRRWTWAIVLGTLLIWGAFIGSSYVENRINHIGWFIYESAIALMRALAVSAILFCALVRRRLRLLEMASLGAHERPG